MPFEGVQREYNIYINNNLNFNAEVDDIDVYWSNISRNFPVLYDAVKVILKIPISNAEN